MRRLVLITVAIFFRLIGWHQVFAADLERWQRHKDVLKKRLDRIRFPPLTNITLDGQNFKLPLRAIEPLRAPSQEELEYLVGFFDGDGCVTMDKQTGEVKLMMSQSVNTAEVLLPFRSLLGGSVSRMRPSTGSTKAQVLWQVWGSQMTAAAETLSQVPSMKQAQLLIAQEGTVPKSGRMMVSQDLRGLKQKNYVPQQLPQCSWLYFAGFFDAEGSIAIRPNAASCILRIAQVNPCVLLQLLQFLHSAGLQSWRLYHYKRSSQLRCSDLDACKGTLKQLLTHGLQVKAQQARLALTLTTQNHLEIRKAIAALKGNQNRYNRLDSQGIARSKQINRLQARIHRCDPFSEEENDALRRELHELQKEHKLKNTKSQCILLRKDTRKALREGGSYTQQETL